MSTTFNQIWKAAKEKYGKPILYKRSNVYKLLGFKNSKALTDWLRENDFLYYGDYPENYLIEEGLMECEMKYVTPKSNYDEDGYDIGRYDYDGTSKTKSFAVPLFTLKGIQYFKDLLANPAELKKVTEEIQLKNKPYKIRVV